MSNKDRYADTMRNELNCLIHDLFGFGTHFPFFFGESIFHEDINMRNGIKGDLLCEHFRAYLIIHKDALCLIEQLIHTSLTCARCCLIG